MGENVRFGGHFALHLPTPRPQISPVGLHFPDYLRQFHSIGGTLPIFGLFCPVILLFNNK